MTRRHPWINVRRREAADELRRLDEEDDEVENEDDGLFPCTGPNGVKTKMSRGDFCRLYGVDRGSLREWMNKGATMNQARAMWEFRAGAGPKNIKALEDRMMKMRGRGKMRLDAFRWYRDRESVICYDPIRKVAVRFQCYQLWRDQGRTRKKRKVKSG